MDFRTALAAALLFSAVPAQVDWVTNAPVGRWQHRTVYDAARDRVLLFGGTLPRSPGGIDLGDTWEWDGALWTRRFPAHAPAPRAYHALAYDSRRARVVLFGGVDLAGRRFGDTWEWDGSDWLLRSPANVPPARSLHAMCYDAARGRTVLFGGSDARGNDLAETWEWDGVDWQRAAPATPPPALRFASLVHDPLRRRSVLFGGTGAGGATRNVWEYDGVRWQRSSYSTGPSGRIMHAAAFDATLGAVIVMDGVELAAGGFAVDAWAFDGRGWTALARLPGPEAAFGGSLAHDSRRGRTVHFGGGSSAGSPTAVWEFDGAAWLRATAVRPLLGMPQVADDTARGRAVLFGGTGQHGVVDETWEWDGQSWLRRSPANSPAARIGAAISYDAGRRRVVLFGGGDGGGALFDDTWEWDGVDWSQVQTSQSPRRRHFARMAYDVRRGRTVLFGGYEHGGAVADTWEYDGRDWSLLNPATIPPARHSHAMVFDPGTGRTLMFGGDQDFLARLDDTWEWDGVDWRIRQPSARPAPRSLHALVHDPLRDRVVLHGGMTASTTLLADVWEWDGLDWTPRATDTAALPRAAFGMVFRAGRVAVFGGSGPIGTTDDLWTYGPKWPARFDLFGAGCAGSAGVPALAPEQGAAAWLGGTLGIRVGLLRPGAPAILLLGDSDRQWGSVSLPLRLGPYGMRGCNLLVAPLADTAALASAGGEAVFRLPVCACPSLLGARLFAQALAADPAANPTGAVVSAGALIVVGGR